MGFKFCIDSHWNVPVSNWNVPIYWVLGGYSVNWALIGASTIAGQYMIAALRAQQAGKISWVFSGSQARAISFANDHGIANASSQLEQVLRDPLVDAVYISSTNEEHYAHALAAIAAGKHVLCEKPLAMTVSDANEIVNAAKVAGVTFATNHHLRCAGSIQAIKSVVTDGTIGQVLSMRVFNAVHLPLHLRGWRLDNPQASGGVIPDLTVHNADVVRFILGEDPHEVSAQMGMSGMVQGVEDSAMLVWTMPSGAMVMSHDSFAHPFAASGVEVHGTEGSIVARNVLGQDPNGEVELITKEGRQIMPFAKHNLYGETVRQFVQAVIGQSQPAATGLDGVKSLAVALAVRDAARSGSRQIIDYGDCV